MFLPKKFNILLSLIFLEKNIIVNDPVIELNTYRNKLLNCNPYKFTGLFNTEPPILINAIIKI